MLVSQNLVSWQLNVVQYSSLLGPNVGPRCCKRLIRKMQQRKFRVLPLPLVTAAAAPLRIGCSRSPTCIDATKNSPQSFRVFRKKKTCVICSVVYFVLYKSHQCLKVNTVCVSKCHKVSLYYLVYGKLKFKLSIAYF